MENQEELDEFILKSAAAHDLETAESNNDLGSVTQSRQLSFHLVSKLYGPASHLNLHINIHFCGVRSEFQMVNEIKSSSFEPQIAFQFAN